MSFLVFTDLDETKAARKKRDDELGYPESLESLRWVGGGRHCPKEFGRAYHYCEIIEHKDGGSWAIEEVGEFSKEETATIVSKVPTEWMIARENGEPPIKVYVKEDIKDAKRL